MKSVELEVPADMTVQTLKDKLAGDYPNLKEIDEGCIGFC